MYYIPVVRIPKFSVSFLARFISCRNGFTAVDVSYFTNYFTLHVPQGSLKR